MLFAPSKERIVDIVQRHIIKVNNELKKSDIIWYFWNHSNKLTYSKTTKKDIRFMLKQKMSYTKSPLDERYLRRPGQSSDEKIGELEGK